MRTVGAAAAAFSLAVLAVTPARAELPPPPSQAACAAARASRELPAVEALDPRPGALRVFAMQFKQEIRHVISYESYRTKIECMVRDYVVPHLAPGAANVVAFNEDVGLATIATGSRGAAARTIAADPRAAPSCESQGIPCGTLAALGALKAGYSRQLAAYRAMFPGLGPLSGVFVAATDTFVRGFMQTFSDMARRYHVYILGSNNQATFRESTDPQEITLFSDPDLPRPPSVYVATSDQVHNAAFLWAPDDTRSDGPPPTRNLVATNLKVPLTSLELQLGFAPGPASGPEAVANVRPYAIPGTAARLAFATSLPAFVFGEPPPGADPCSDTSRYYMRCLDSLGTNVVVQDEANPGRWAGNGSSYWQPLEWMGSAYRAVFDASVHFPYSVNPMMVGNLADLAFDGQSAITARGLRGHGCAYIGDGVLVPADGDPQSAVADTGKKPEFLGLLPWVSGDASRAALRDLGARLAPGSRDPLENDYVESAVVADLVFPADLARPACAGSSAQTTVPATSPSRGRSGALRLGVRPRSSLAGVRTRFRFSARAGHRAVAGATIAFAGRRLRSDRRGLAAITLTLERPGRAVARATARGLVPARTSVLVRARRPRLTG
ncbi:MAG: hypothetical protein NVSMB25_23160 [Thermoleophilaceae bacterium]